MAVYITWIYQPTNAHIISHKTHLKHFKIIRHVSTLSDHHQGALFLAKVILQYSQFNSYLQNEVLWQHIMLCCGTVARCESNDAHLASWKCRKQPLLLKSNHLVFTRTHTLTSRSLPWYFLSVPVDNAFATNVSYSHFNLSTNECTYNFT